MSIEHRRPVWIALSELFLDTDITISYSGITQMLAASPYSIEELKAILFDEVFPVLQGNMRSPAGVWEGFDEEWLLAEAVKRIGKKPLLRLPFISRDIKEQWNELVPLILNLREAQSEPRQ